MHQSARNQLFLSELCDVLGVGHPDPTGADARLNNYVFERRVDYPAAADRDHGFIDLYRQGHFVLEAKQDSDEPVPSEAEKFGIRALGRRWFESNTG